MQVSGGQGAGEVKKSEEIPSYCLGTNSYQRGEEGLAFTSQEKGAPQLHPEVPTPPPHRCPQPCPPYQARAAPFGPSLRQAVPRVAAHLGQGLLCPPPAPHAAPSLRTRPLPPPRRPGLGPVPRVPASQGPEA